MKDKYEEDDDYIYHDPHKLKYSSNQLTLQ